MNQVKNNQMALAIKSACNAQCLTVHGLRSSLPRGPQDDMLRTADGKVDLTKKPIRKHAASAMASVVATAGDKTTAAKGKPENYSPEVTAELVQAYKESDKSDDTIKGLAERFGKTTRSIVAKLSRENVYEKKTYKTKSGGVPVSKEQHVLAIAAFMGVSPDKLESLEKANKTVLQLLEAALKRSAQDHANNNPEVVETEEDKASKAESLARLSEALEVEQEQIKSLKLADRETLQLIASRV